MPILEDLEFFEDLTAAPLEFLPCAGLGAEDVVGADVDGTSDGAEVGHVLLAMLTMSAVEPHPMPMIVGLSFSQWLAQQLLM